MSWVGRSYHYCLIAVLAGIGLNACGAAEPFNMPSDAIMFVGQPSPVQPIEFIVDPVQQAASGTMNAEIEDVFPDRTTLSLLSLNLTFNFDGIGDIVLTLDPNRPSSATVFPLNASGNPTGLSTMDLNLVIETPDQNLVLEGVLLQGESAILQLAIDLPSLGFFFQGMPQELDLAAMSVVLPNELILSGSSNQ